MSAPPYPPAATDAVPGESLLGWCVRIARRRGRPHLGRLLREVGLAPLAKPGALPRGAVEPRSVALALGADPMDVERRMLLPRRDGFELLDGVVVRAMDVVTKTRRFSPATLGREPFHRSTWMLRTLPFCPMSWEYLTDHCGRCGTVQGWKRSISVRRCDRCGSELARHPAATVAEELRPTLREIAALVRPSDPAHARSLAHLPPPLRDLSAGEAFELTLAIARSLRTDVPLREPERVCRRHGPALAEGLAEAWPLVLDWPASVGDRLAEPSRHRPFLARLAAQSTSVPERNCLPGVARAFEALLSDDRDAVRVKSAARMLGATEGEVAAARDDGPLASVAVIRGGRFCSNLVASEIETLAAARRDRVGLHPSARRIGMPTYGLEQLIASGAVELVDHPWFRSRPGGPVLTGAEMDRLVARLAELGRDGVDDPVPLAAAMRGFGGGPKPWGGVVSAMLDGRIAFEARPAGRLLRLAVSRADAEAVRAMAPGVGRATYSQAETMDILNVTAKRQEALAALPHEASGPTNMRFDGRAVEEVAASRTSLAELMALTGMAGKTIAASLARAGLHPIDAFGWERSRTLAHLAKRNAELVPTGVVT